MNKDSFEILISDVPNHKIFYCCDGSCFKNLEELQKALKKMNLETFKCHVNSKKNDFANWIYDVIGDINLSKNLREIFDSKIAAKKLKVRINYIKKKIKDLGENS